MLKIKKSKLAHSRIFHLTINKYFYYFLIACFFIAGLLYFKSYYVIPIERVSDTSELIMLADLNDDKTWNNSDKILLDKILANPWSYSDLQLLKIDINRNHAIDAEDIKILNELYDVSNPYQLFINAGNQKIITPKAREFFSYRSVNDYIQRPVYGLSHAILNSGPLNFLRGLRTPDSDSPYLSQLSREIYDEALHFSFIYNKRKSGLSKEEIAFVNSQLKIIHELYARHDNYALLLHLILLSEAGETLSTSTQIKFVKNVRLLAIALRKYLRSPQYASFTAGELPWQTVLSELDKINAQTSELNISLKKVESPRDLTNIQNYIDRAEWQVYKSKARANDFHRLISFAQTDRRYLRAVSNTSARHEDLTLENHNIPMMLLFKHAMTITNNDKKSAVGLLDEAIRIPFFWVKTIPSKLRPTSVALEHFLLPGNKEDGSDKSRHWNVFGGLSLYKSPEESLTLAFKREILDVRKANYSPEAMTEFIRDMIANCYGIYHIVSFDTTHH